MLDLSEADLRPFRLGRDSSSGAIVDLPTIQLPPRDKVDFPDANPSAPAFPQPLVGGVTPPKTPPKKPGGGGGSALISRLALPTTARPTRRVP